MNKCEPIIACHYDLEKFNKIIKVDLLKQLIAHENGFVVLLIYLLCNSVHRIKSLINRTVLHIHLE